MQASNDGHGFRRVVTAVIRASGRLVDALLPPPPVEIALARGGASIPGARCLSSEEAYALTLERSTGTGPRYQWVGTREGIERFASAIGPIAAARHSARRAAGECVTAAMLAH